MSRQEEEERQKRLQRQRQKQPEHIVLTDSEPEEIDQPPRQAKLSHHKTPSHAPKRNYQTIKDRQSSTHLEKPPAASSSTKYTSQLQSSSKHSTRERSLSISSTSSTASLEKNAPPAATSQTALASSTPVSAFLADRAKMERERLARQKRLRPQVQQPEETESEEEEDGPPPAKKVKAEDGGSRTAPSYTSTQKQPATSSSEPLFWEGEIRQTANRHVLPSKDTKPVWRLSEILGQRVRSLSLCRPTSN